MVDTIKESLICCALLKFWTALSQAWNDSRTGRAIHRFEAWCERGWHGSALVGFFTREGTLSASWAPSLSCRLLTWLINLPASALHWLYRKLQPYFDGSFFAALAFDMGESTAIAVSWLVALLLSIPYERWNNAYSLMGFFLCLLLLVAGGMRRRTFRLNAAAVGPYAVLLAASVCLAVVFSAYRGLSYRFFLFHLTCMILVIVTVSAVRHAGDLVRLAAGAGLGVFTSSAYGVVQRIQGVEVNASYVDLTLNKGMPGRVYSFFDNPNAFAEMLIFFLPLVLALVFCSKRWYNVLAALGVFCMGVGVVLMTYSRASWIGLAVSLLLFVFLWKPKLLPGLILLGIACIPLLPDTILNRIMTITNLKDTSTSSRFPLYEAALALIRQSPVTGAGLGTDAVKEYISVHNLYHARAPFVHSHNIYLQIWVEQGILGLLAFLGTMLWGYKSAAAAIKGKVSRQAKFITLAGASAIAGAMVCGMADYLWNYPRVMCMFWYLFAVTAAGIKVCKMEKDLI